MEKATQDELRALRGEVATLSQGLTAMAETQGIMVGILQQLLAAATEEQEASPLSDAVREMAGNIEGLTQAVEENTSTTRTIIGILHQWGENFIEKFSRRVRQVLSGEGDEDGVVPSEHDRS